ALRHLFDLFFFASLAPNDVVRVVGAPNDVVCFRGAPDDVVAVIGPGAPNDVVAVVRAPDDVVTVIGAANEIGGVLLGPSDGTILTHSENGERAELRSPDNVVHLFRAPDDVVAGVRP